MLYYVVLCTTDRWQILYHFGVYYVVWSVQNIEYHIRGTPSSQLFRYIPHKFHFAKGLRIFTTCVLNTIYTAHNFNLFIDKFKILSYSHKIFLRIIYNIISTVTTLSWLICSSVERLQPTMSNALSTPLLSQQCFKLI